MENNNIKIEFVDGRIVECQIDMDCDIFTDDKLTVNSQFIPYSGEEVGGFYSTSVLDLIKSYGSVKITYTKKD